MDSRVTEIERWRRERVDPAIHRLEADNREIKDDIRELRRDTRSGRRWSIASTVCICAVLLLTVWMALHGR